VALVHAVELERALEVLDGVTWLPAPVGHLPEARMRVRTGGIPRNHLRVQRFRACEVVEAKRELGLEERAGRLARSVRGTRGQPVLGDAETAPELAKKLEGGNAVPGLDA
jgi:hypothetical protein